MKKIFFTVSAFIFLAQGALAQSDFSPSHFSYIFHLYYDNGRLSADKDVGFKYDIIATQYIPSQGPYKGEIINFAGAKAATFEFDPTGGNQNFKAGKIKIPAPYTANAKEVSFYNNQGARVLTIDLSASSYCNDNKVCDEDRGENFRACPNDCEAIDLPAATTTPDPNQDEQAGRPLIPILVVVGLVLSVIIVFYRYWIKKKSINA